MKRQRGVNGAGNPPKFEGSGVEVAEMAAMGGKKKAKREAEKVKENKGKGVEEERKESREMGSVEDGNNGMGWSNWEEYWPWLGGVVDEQMSWGSIWLPIWDMDFIGGAFDSLYSDVVWDDDIWNLRKEIPNPSER